MQVGIVFKSVRGGICAIFHSVHGCRLCALCLRSLLAESTLFCSLPRHFLAYIFCTLRSPIKLPRLKHPVHSPEREETMPKASDFDGRSPEVSSLLQNLANGDLDQSHTGTPELITYSIAGANVARRQVFLSDCSCVLLHAGQEYLLSTFSRIPGYIHNAKRKVPYLDAMTVKAVHQHTSSQVTINTHARTDVHPRVSSRTVLASNPLRTTIYILFDTYPTHAQLQCTILLARALANGTNACS